MSNNTGYGVVYTPDPLSDYVAHLLIEEFWKDASLRQPKTDIMVLDPACGEGALLAACKRNFELVNEAGEVHYVGIDVESEVISANIEKYDKKTHAFYACDALLPTEGKKPVEFWHEKKIAPELIIANPPWSSEKIYCKEKLTSAGYKFDVGQYDSYVLFIELCMNMLKPNGCAAFIIPDSIFAGENRELRKYLAEKTELRVIARLGEKLFAGVNRATTVLVIKKATPTENSKTTCFRLTTDQRRAYFAGDTTLLASHRKYAHSVSQKRFSCNAGYIFDIDTQKEEENILGKMESNTIVWKNLFHFGRGVEISKSGVIVVCPHCGAAQGYSKKQFSEQKKACTKCSKHISVTSETVTKIIDTKPFDGSKKIYVGENLHRYEMRGACYIKMGVPGINYKEDKLYEPPKILIRKTGLGINACIDYESTYISQTVYSCNYLNEGNPEPLEYYLGVLNSRILYYYYLKKYGENEWKSHPYFTKDIIFSLPIPQITQNNEAICRQIAEKVLELGEKYSRSVDLQIEKLVAMLYGLNFDEINMVARCLNQLPNLGAINHMKIKEDELCLDI